MYFGNLKDLAVESLIDDPCTRIIMSIYASKVLNTPVHFLLKKKSKNPIVRSSQLCPQPKRGSRKARNDKRGTPNLGSSWLPPCPGCPIHAIAASSTSSPLRRQQGCHDKQASKARGEDEERAETRDRERTTPHGQQFAQHAQMQRMHTGHACVHEQLSRASSIQRRDETTFPLFFLSHKIHLQPEPVLGEACVIAERSPDIASLLDPQ